MVKLREHSGRYMVTISGDIVKGLAWSKGAELLLIPDLANNQLIIKKLSK